VTELVESNNGPAFTNAIGDEGVAVAVGVGTTLVEVAVTVGVGVSVGIVKVCVGVAVGVVVAVVVGVGEAFPGMRSTACPLITGDPMVAPVAGNLELAVYRLEGVSALGAVSSPYARAKPSTGVKLLLLKSGIIAAGWVMVGAVKFCDA
jgi:hypothetical protein